MGNNGTYHTVGSWDNSAGDDVWHHNTVTLNERHLGEKTTIRITATLPSAFNLFDLFNSDTEARIIALDNVVIRGTGSAADTADLPNLTVYNVSASPESVDSGAQVKIRYNVRNSGTARASKETVSVYRHTSATDTPETGGTQVSTFAMQSTLAPGGGFGRATNVKTPSVSEDTVMHYYVCVSAAEGETKTDDNCDHVTVTVKAKVVETPEPETPVETSVIEPVETPTETPAEDDNKQVVINTPAEDYTETSYPRPPYESCYHSPERKHVMAGDVMLPRPLRGKIRDRDGVYSCGTITLGGVETTNGTKGFIVSNHVIRTEKDYTLESLTSTAIIIGHGEYMETYDMGRLLGKVYKRSDIRHRPSPITHDKYDLIADASFVAYPRPKTVGCSLTWRSGGETFCLDLGGN